MFQIYLFFLLFFFWWGWGADISKPVTTSIPRGGERIMGMHEIVRSTVSRENLEKGQNSQRKTATLFEWMCSTETEGEKKRV